MTGFELERVETLLRERSAEMTRTPSKARPEVGLGDSVREPPPPPEPVVEVSVEGICQDCGDRISSARLKALPNAVRCVACQRVLEASAG